MLDTQSVKAQGLSVSQLLMLLTTAKSPLPFKLSRPVVNPAKANGDTSGTYGTVSQTYGSLSDMQVDDCEWFHGAITRQEAIDRLTAMGLEDGTYLIRNKDDSPRSFALSLVYHNKIRHDLLAIEEDGTLLINGKECAKKVKDISEAVKHLEKSQESLPINLRIACPNLLS